MKTKKSTISTPAHRYGRQPKRLPYGWRNLRSTGTAPDILHVKPRTRPGPSVEATRQSARPTSTADQSNLLLALPLQQRHSTFEHAALDARAPLKTTRPIQ